MSGPGIIQGVRQQANVFLGAVMFLTRVPVGKLYEYRREDVARSAVYFPVVGLLVGVVGALVLAVSQMFFPVWIAALLCMAATVGITGGLHEDGLADAADGLLGGSTPTRRLEIMKDSRLGAYGALALWFSLTAKLLLLAMLLAQGLRSACAALVVAHGLGRASCVALLCFCPYVRPEDSKAKPFGDSVTFREFLWSLVLPVALAVLLLGPRAAPCVLAAALLTWAARVYFTNKLGGITGDCLGATNQMVELICYLVLLAKIPSVRF